MNTEVQCTARRSTVATSIVAAVLLATAALLWLRAAGVEHWVASFRAHYESASPHDLSLDPQLGTEVSLPERDAFGHAVMAELGVNARVLLVLSGGCGACSDKGENLTELQGAAVEQVILVYPVRASDIPEHYAKVSNKLRFIADPSNFYGRALNASWLPRYYLLSSEGKLLALQPSPRTPWRRLIE